MTPAESASPAERRLCANCYRELAPGDRFCAHCGQSAERHVPTLFELVHEFFSHYVALDGGEKLPARGERGISEGLVGETGTHGRRQRSYAFEDCSVGRSI